MIPILFALLLLTWTTSAQKWANTDAGFFDPFVLGFSYFNILLILVVAIAILLCVITACCCFGSKRPPVEYRDIIGKYGDEDPFPIKKKKRDND